MSHPSLTLAQAERLEMLIEECGEVIQAATKILRHGYDSTHPDNEDESGTHNNRTDLEDEIKDVLSVVSGMGVKRDVYIWDTDGLYSLGAQALWNLKLAYTHHQGEKTHEA